MTWGEARDKRIILGVLLTRERAWPPVQARFSEPDAQGPPSPHERGLGSARARRGGAQELGAVKTQDRGFI